MKSVPLSVKMKAVGRGMAKVQNQTSGAKPPMKFRSGGQVPSGNMAIMKHAFPKGKKGC